MTSIPPDTRDIPGHGGVNPLGGKIHPQGSEPSRRRWSGFVAYVRVCPSCGWENDEHALFCTACAADLRNVTPIASSDPRPGTAVLQKRMDRDRRQHERRRAGETRGGGGWIAFGAALILGTLVVNPEPAIAGLLWIVAVASAVAGIWQLRFDTRSMRLWGGILATSAVLLLAFVGFRAIQASELVNGGGNSPGAVTEPTATAPAIDLATPALDTLSGSVPMYQGDAAHSGVMPGPPPAQSPALAWQADTGGELYAAPTLANGLLYVCTKTGTLNAYDAATGNLAWSHELTTYVTRATPAVVDGVVYVGGGFVFKALDATTGQELWKVDLQYGGQASPTVAGELVIVSSQQGWLYALDRANGELAWRIPTEGLAFGAAAVSGDNVIYGTDEGIVYNATLSSGRLNWRTTVPGAVFSTPVIAGSTVFVSTESGELHALDLETGQNRWKASHGSAQPPAVSREVVVVSAADGGVYGLDPATGEQMWLYPSGKETLTAPVIVDGLVVVGAGSSLLALDAATGESRWYYLAGDIIESPPVVADGHVFFGGRDGFLYAVTDG